MLEQEKNLISIKILFIILLKNKRFMYDSYYYYNYLKLKNYFYIYFRNNIIENFSNLLILRANINYYYNFFFDNFNFLYKLFFLFIKINDKQLLWSSVIKKKFYFKIKKKLKKIRKKNYKKLKKLSRNIRLKIIFFYIQKKFLFNNINYKKLFFIISSKIKKKKPRWLLYKRYFFLKNKKLSLSSLFLQRLIRLFIPFNYFGFNKLKFSYFSIKIYRSYLIFNLYLLNKYFNFILKKTFLKRQRTLVEYNFFKNINLSQTSYLILLKYNKYKKFITSLIKKKTIKKSKRYVFKNNLYFFNFFYKKYNKFYFQLHLFFIFIFYKIKKIIFKPVDFNLFKLNYLKIFSYIKNSLNLVYKNFYYICFLKKTKSNFYITITNRIGAVILSYSTGFLIGFKKKKKRKSIKSLPFLINFVSKKLKQKSINTLWKIYLQSKLKRSIKIIFFGFFKNNIKIKKLSYINIRFHSKPYRFKKIRRI